jgi:hypothetical protein
LKSIRIVGWVILLIAAVFWIAAIGGATASGFFETENSVQLLILGGAVAMIGGMFLWYDD